MEYRDGCSEGKVRHSPMDRPPRGPHPWRMRVFGGLLLLMWLAAGSLGAQQPDTTAQDSAVTRGPWVARALAITGAYWAVSIPVMERVWYRDQARVPFHVFDDSRGYLQVDKFGHAWGAYVQSYAGYHWLKRAGRPERTALLYGGALGFALQAPIEVMDGLHEGWGFSWSDMAANAAGSALVVAQALAFDEQVAKYKFSYRPSRYAAMANGYLGTSPLERLAEDYNGHTYWLSVPLSRVAPARVPAWLNVAVGYGANGMIGEFRNLREHEGIAIPETPRYRQYLLSLDLDWTRIPTDSPRLRKLLTALTLVKAPSPALEVDSRGRWRAHWLFY